MASKKKHKKQKKSKPLSKSKKHSNKIKAKKPKTPVRMRVISFVVSLAMIIWGYFSDNFIVMAIGGGLLFMTLLLYVIKKRIVQRKKITKQKKIEKRPIVKREIKTVKKETKPITKLFEKEKLLDKIQYKKKSMLFMLLFLFSLVPVYLGYNNHQYITLSLGLLLTIISIFGLFRNLSKLKHTVKKFQPEPKIKKKVVVKKAEKAKKKVSSDKTKSHKKLIFILSIIIVIGLINAAIFLLPKTHMWIYIVIGGTIVFSFLFFMSIKHRKHKVAKVTKPEEGVTEKEISEKTVLDEDVAKVLKITDELLGNLSEEQISKFAQSKDFELYERVLNKYNIK